MAPELVVITTPAHVRRRAARRAQLAYRATLFGLLGMLAAAWAAVLLCVASLLGVL